MKFVRYKLSELKVSENGKRELNELEKMDDGDIDYSDLPQLPDDFFEKAKAGAFYHPENERSTSGIEEELEIPNQETLNAIREVEDGKCKSYSSFSEFMEEIDREIAEEDAQKARNQSQENS